MERPQLRSPGYALASLVESTRDAAGEKHP